MTRVLMGCAGELRLPEASNEAGDGRFEGGG